MSEASIKDVILKSAERLEAAELWYGHGTGNALDEAAALVLHVAGLLGQDEPDFSVALPEPQRAEVGQLLERRINERLPLPYLLGEAWFCGRPYHVDQRVLIPRSPIAELIDDGFSPWLAAPPQRILEIGTGSGCIAIACALAFPEAEVVATDISPDALAVARSNVARHGVGDRLQLLQADLYEGLDKIMSGKFDLIVTNPPYVPAEEVISLPAEYNHEPVLALESGDDGLDASRVIIERAPEYLTDNGALILEVGAYWESLDAAFPGMPFMWLEFERGGEGVALLPAQELKAALTT